MKEKVILAYSGGLDTTFCVLHLQEKGYEVVSAIVNTGGFSFEQLKEIEKKAISLGVVKHYSIDAQDKIYSQIIQYAIKMNSLYENSYPVMCTDRYIIASELIKIAEKEKANIVAHGSTANGNDQVRFDSAFLSLNPNIKILCPIKYLNISREEEIAYLDQKGIKFSDSNRKYSINENVFGNTFSGSEIDEDKEPAKDSYKLTKVNDKLNKDSFEYLDIEFEKGKPIALNGKKANGLDILKQINKLAGAYGYGRDIYSGDCIIGIKGRIMFEAPGLLCLIEAHKKLEQYVLSKHQIFFNNMVSDKWTDLVYSGLYYEPLVKNLEDYCDSVQENVSGIVKVKLQLNSIMIVSVQSENSLISSQVATYAQKGSWSNIEADGFIKLYSLQQKIVRIKSKKK